jgi:pre-mRNA cleavage complex 2 protein Pcf11
MEDHLDMHFRQNRKANQNVGRGHNRSWFTALDDWIHDVSDVKGKSKADRHLNSKTAAAEELAKREEELRALYVVVPPGDEAKPISCPVCKELLKSEFLEDDEEWVWKNAIKKDDRVCIDSPILRLHRADFVSTTDIPCYLSCGGSIIYE